MSTVTKRWWRVAVLSAVAGGAIGVARYAAASEEPAVWARSATPTPPVVQVAAAFPVPAQAGAAAQPPTSAPGVVPPLTPPALPGFDPPGIPPAPKPIDITPVAPPMPLVPPITKPVTPAPSPVVPPPAEIAQPAPSAKLADPVKPTPPVVPDFNLQPPKTANTFRTDEPASPTLPIGPVLPPITPPTSSRGDVPAIPVDRPKPVEGPLLDSEKDTFPLPKPAPIPTPPTTHPGDPVMTNYFKQSALAAVIGSALAGAPLTPANAFPAPSPQAKTDPTPAELQKALDSTNAKLTETNTKLAEVQTTLKRLSDLMDGKRDSLNADPGLAAEVKRLTDLIDGKREKGMKIGTDPGVTDEVKRLKDTVHSLQAQIDGMKKTEAFRPPSPLPVPDPMAGKGTVRVVNDYPVEISIVVNEKSYRIAASTKLDVPVPAGDFSYQLLQNGASAVKSTIKEKETVTLRIK
jgi:hypothetical protein